MAELETRVSVLEVRVASIEGTQGKVEGKLDDLKERLDKQSAILPGLVDSMKSIEAKQDSLIERFALNASRDAEVGTRVKVLWGIIAALGTGALGLIGKVLFGS